MLYGNSFQEYGQASNVSLIAEDALRPLLQYCSLLRQLILAIKNIYYMAELSIDLFSFMFGGQFHLITCPQKRHEKRK